MPWNFGDGNNKHRRKGKWVRATKRTDASISEFSCSFQEMHYMLHSNTFIEFFFLSVTGSKKLSLHNNGNQRLFEMKMPYSRWIVILLDA
jgi:hypothetical protein